MTVLRLAHPIKREATLHGITEPVIIQINPGGIEMNVKGTRHRIFGSWELIAKHLLTETDVLAHLYGKPWELLEQQDFIAKQKRKNKNKNGS